MTMPETSSPHTAVEATEGSRAEARTPYDWQDDAACATVATDIFFPEQGESPADAKRICATCTVTAACLALSMKRKERYGIWGGKTERQRRTMRSKR